MSSGPVLPRQTREGQFAVAVCVLLAIYCGWVLSFPAFPTQDGAVHLYYADVLRHLGDPSSIYARFFFPRTPVPPYAVHYLLLGWLAPISGLLLAEKLIVCLIVILFVTGTWYLAASFGQYGGRAALLSLPLSLNWTVGMGFHNYALSLGVSLFALGFWFRACRENRLTYTLAYVGACGLMLFTHPVPLLVTLGVSFVHLVFSKAGRMAETARVARSSIWAFLTSASLLSYLFLFVSRDKTKENLHHSLIQKGMLRDAILGRPLMLVYRTPGAYLYSILLYGLLLVCLWTAFSRARARWFGRAGNAGDVLLITALFAFVTYPLIPRNMNGSDFFADRLLIYVWLFPVTAALSRIDLPLRSLRWLAPAGSVLALVPLLLSDADMRTASRLLAQMEQTQALAPGKTGLFIDAPIVPAKLHTTFDPFLWAGARYFRRTGTVMLNAPWLDLPILPLEAKEQMFSRVFSGPMMNYPDRLPGLLIASCAARERVSPDIDFLLFIGKSRQSPEARDRVVEVPWPHPWDCRVAGWSSVCARRNDPS